MAKRYRPVARDQVFLFPPDMREWRRPDHPVWLVITVVEDHLDTSAFHAGRRTGGAGAAGYDPDMLLALLTWAYAHQVTSSRRIEALCGTDVAFRVICAGDAPDHSTIARVRSDFPGAIEEFFAGVLVVCARLGMGKLGVIALDGTKIAGSAPESANRAEEGLRKLAAQSVAAHAAADAAEDELFGPGRRGDEVPEDAWRPGSRKDRIAAALADLEAERRAAAARQDQQAQEYLERARAGTPRRGSSPRQAAVQLAQLKAERELAAQQAKIDDWERRNAAKLAACGRALNNRPVPAACYTRVREAEASLERARDRAAEAQRKAAEREKNRKGPGPVRNITDPHSRLMPVRGGGFIQGCNAQNVVSADGLVIATRVTADTADTCWFEPMLRQAQDAARLITARQPPAAAGSQAPATGGPHHSGPRDSGDDPGGDPALIGLLLADAGCLSEDNLKVAGPGRLIATGKHRDLEKAARGGQAGPAGNKPLTAAMAARLATPDGITAYRQRGHIAETPHGNIKHNMAFRQLTMRGTAKAHAEWTFACAVHNLLKAITAGKLTTAALDHLATQPS